MSFQKVIQKDNQTQKDIQKEINKIQDILIKKCEQQLKELDGTSLFRQNHTCLLLDYKDIKMFTPRPVVFMGNQRDFTHRFVVTSENKSGEENSVEKKPDKGKLGIIPVKIQRDFYFTPFPFTMSFKIPESTYRDAMEKDIWYQYSQETKYLTSDNKRINIEACNITFQTKNVFDYYLGAFF